MPEAAPTAKPDCGACSGCPFQARYEWTEKISNRVMDADGGAAFGTDGKN